MPQRHPLHRESIIILMMWVVVTLFGALAHAALPPAGPSISNQAEATFKIPDSTDPNLLRSKKSNIVIVEVQPVYALTLTPGYTQVVEPGSRLTWTHTLTNTSNTTDIFSFSLTDSGGDDGALAPLRLYLDSNNNGVFDAADTLVTAGVTQSLDAGKSVLLFVDGTVPVGALDGQHYLADVTARGAGSGATLTQSDEARVVASGLVPSKTVDKVAAVSGDILTYGMTLQNISDLAASPTQVSVDNAVSAKILADDPLPDGVRLAAVPVYSGPGKLVYHLGGAPRGVFTTVAPKDLFMVDRIGVAYDSFPARTTDSWSFTALVSDRAVGQFVLNQYQALYRNAGIERAVLSNTVQTKVEGAASLINKDGYDASAQLALRISLKQGENILYLETKCSLCNKDPAVNDYLVIRITSGNNPLVTNFSDHDEEIVTLRETGPNTGIFHVVGFGEAIPANIQELGIPAQDAFQHPVSPGNHFIETVKHDKLIATILNCLNPDGSRGQAVNVSADVLVDPFGVLFDTTTNQPISGAIVSLVNMAACTNKFDLSTCALATVFEDELGTKPAAASITTGPDGAYRFPFVPAGTYALLIKAPKEYTYPSLIGKDVLAKTWPDRVVVTGSYGEQFMLIPALGPVEIDVPMDPFVPNMQLFVQKTGNRDTVEIGDFVDYTLNIKNAGTKAALSVEASDKLPVGFSYVPGTAFLDGVKRNPDSVTATGLRFVIGTMAPAESHKITYRLRASTDSLRGDGINRASAYENRPGGGTSNQAVYKVRVLPGPFTTDGYITGKIYTDCNRNGVQDPEEVGVPGVRFYMEDGTMVISDVEGKYSLYGIRARTHVLKLDRSTLPKDVELIEQSVRNAGDPGSVFVDLKAGELHRADFAVTTGTGACEGPAMEEIFQRRANGDAPIGELERVLKADLPVNPISIGDVRSLPASGCLGGGDQQCGVHGKANLPMQSRSLIRRNELDDAPEMADDADGLSGSGRRIPTEPVMLESYLSGADRQLEFLNLQDEEILPVSQTNIMIKGRLGADIRLLVNGELVPSARIGKKITVEDTQIEGREYIGVNLKAGRNLLELKQFDAAGNNRGTVVLNVVAPGVLHNLQLDVRAKGNVEANGTNEVPMFLTLTDKDGVPVTTRTEVTLETSAGRFRQKDVNPVEPGTQIFIEGGEATLTLVAPTEAAIASIVVRSGTVRQEAKVKFVPELRPMVASGIVEGMIRLKDFDSSKITPAQAADGFEDELHTLASANDGKLNFQGRSAFFLKGKVKGEYLLTMSYDSDKQRNQSLFRDIRPEEYYPVYGDSAVRGFDAQSSGKLYVRVDKGRSSVLYGDYTTRVDGTHALDLGQYSRSLTGIKTHYEGEKTTANAFVARTNATQVSVEVPAQGVSGPYTVSGVNGLLVNSEKVEILIRDRNNPGVILSTIPQSRFVDYEFEPLSASLIFKAPVPSLDANLNPYSIRVTLEVAGDGPEYTVGGVQAERKLGERLSVGGAVAAEDNPAAKYSIGSVNATLKLDADTTLTAEVAQSDREFKGVGQAGRIEIEHHQGKDSWRLYHGQSNADFDNSAASLSSGRTESTAKLQKALSDWGVFRAEASRTEDNATSGARQGAKVSLDKTINRYFGVEAGARYYAESKANATVSSLGVTPYDGVTGRLRLNMQAPQLNGATGYLEYEQDVQESARKMAAAGADYRLGTQGRLYARHEFLSSLSGAYGLNDQQQRNTTVVGVEDQYMRDGKVFSEYRARDAINATDSEAAVGLRNNWNVAQGVRLSTNLEQITTLKGTGANDASAAGLGIEYLPSPLWKATGKLDLRWADSADTILNQLGLAWKINRDWTLLTRNTVSLTDNHKTGNRLLDRFQTGFAWRQVDTNRWDALTRFEIKREDDRSSSVAPVDRTSYIASLHVNYHPVRWLTMAGNYAGKLAKDKSLDLPSESRTHLLGARVITDIGERWEASVQGGRLWGDTGQSRYVAGIETGYLAWANLWVSGGYNFLSYKDADLVGNDYTVDGFYLRFRFKFDEDLFNAAKPGINKTLEPDHVSP